MEPVVSQINIYIFKINLIDSENFSDFANYHYNNHTQTHIHRNNKYKK